MGYGSVFYLRITYPNGKIECSFVAGKSRNAPIRTFRDFNSRRLSWQHVWIMLLEWSWRVLFWTDSMITLNYINNETRRFQTYVSTRIAEIHQLTTTDQWRYCPGGRNPADDASRGLEMPKFLQSERWLTGPAFLLQPEEKWPVTKVQNVPETSLETKKEIYAIEVCHMKSLDVLINNTSKRIKCLRKIAWLHKFIQWIDEKKNPQSPDVEKKITLEDLKRKTKSNQARSKANL